MKQALRLGRQAGTNRLRRWRLWRRLRDDPRTLASVLLPSGFDVHTGNIGIKDDTADVMLLRATDGVAAAAGVFTRSLFSGPSVTLSRRHIAAGAARAMLVLSKNANVANGPDGDAHAKELVELAARAVRCEPEEVLLASTGVIGVPYPMAVIRGYFSDLAGPSPGNYPSHHDAVSAAAAMMTTDTHAKVAEATVEAGPARVVGIAKGVGMIEPNMATMIAVIATDAQVEPTALDAVFRTVVDDTFNALSVDGDTSTSDTAVVLASGAAGPVDPDAFAAALRVVCVDLTRQLAADGEGAAKLLVVNVVGASGRDQAKRVAKSVVNSPLVKTAVAGADPNWGRVAMAVGKCETDTDIDPAKVTIAFGDVRVYPAGEANAERLASYLAGDEVKITVGLGVTDPTKPESQFTAYGCDLTAGYIRINADYTT